MLPTTGVKIYVGIIFWINFALLSGGGASLEPNQNICSY